MYGLVDENVTRGLQELNPMFLLEAMWYMCGHSNYLYSIIFFPTFSHFYGFSIFYSLFFYEQKNSFLNVSICFIYKNFFLSHEPLHMCPYFLIVERFITFNSLIHLDFIFSCKVHNTVVQEICSVIRMFPFVTHAKGKWN